MVYGYVTCMSRRPMMLAALVIAQALCAAFFVSDVLSDVGASLAARAIAMHTAIEIGVTLSLAVGVLLGALALRAALDRQRSAERGLSIASGAFAELLETFFARWGLTPAERDIAMMAIKGLSIAEMAAVRGAAPGTVRAQCARVYAKAGVSGRPQLLSIFIDELMSEPLVDAERLAA